MSRIPAAISLMALIVVAGCVGDPTAYETAPVKLKTEKGTVTCQLYTREQVIWDRAIDRPANMSVKEADELCRAEGRRQQLST